MQHISERIERIRKAQGLSQTALAEAAAIPRQTLGRRLQCPEDFTVKELERIASVLGTSSYDLTFGGAA